jgi:hypothetical protein
MTARLVVLLVVALLGAGVVALVARGSTAPVTLPRLRRFAARQELLVTEANGPLVVRALAVTRRWRALGLSTGVLLGLLWALRDDRLTLNFAAAFLGWFVGAVVAEWRLAGLPVDRGRRTASLARRTVTAYLRRDAAVLLALACLALVALFAAVLLRAGDAGSAGAGLRTEATLWLGVAAAGLAAVTATLRRVASRPQPSVDDGLLAADDALRARSANVLAGSAIVAAGYPAASLLGLVGSTTQGSAAEGFAGAGLAAVVLTVVVGWWVAVRPSPARRAVRTEPPRATAVP